MAEFIFGQTVETREPVVEVTIGPDQPLRPGRYRFRLTVMDEEKNVSEPSEVEVIVRDSQRPTAVLDAEPQVEFGQSFKLSGERSSDVAPGKIVLYQWTLLDTRR